MKTGLENVKSFLACFYCGRVKFWGLALLGFLMFSPIFVSSMQAQGAVGATWDDMTTGEGEASGKFVGMYSAFKGFAGILLLIASAFSVIFFVQGNTKVAIMVFGGAVLLYGAAFFLGIVFKAMG